MYGFYLHRDMHGYFRVNQLIHQKIVEASRNAALLGAYANFAGRIRRVRYSANFARKRERWGEAMREHETILDALRRRAGSELSDILFAHLRNKRTAAVEHLKTSRRPGRHPRAGLKFSIQIEKRFGLIEFCISKSREQIAAFPAALRSTEQAMQEVS